jgi:serine/threonine-protein kinase
VLVIGAIIAWQQLGSGGAAALNDQVVTSTPTAAPSLATPSAPPTPEHTATRTPVPTVSFVEVPALVGLSFDAATAALIGAGLQVGAVRDADGPALSGTVLSAVPEVGRPVAAGSTVDLVIASGSVVVPDVAGADPATARAVLEAAGLVVIDRGTATAGAGAGAAGAWIVTGTDPAAGVRASVGGGVLVLVRSAVTPTPTPTPTPASTPTPTMTPTPTPSRS